MNTPVSKTFYLKILIILLICSLQQVHAQENRSAEFGDLGTNLWLGSYNQFRITDKLYYRAEFHYRRGAYNGIPFVGKMEQIYNRHAINYFVSRNFNMSFGGVLRLDFTPQPGNEEFQFVVPEPRFWHEYLFVMPFPRFQVFHRLRFEHRWSRGSAIEPNWIFRNRYRYKFYMKIPINSTQLSPGTFFFSPDVEIIMQSGRTVVDSPLEDLRLYPSFSYIASPRVTYSAGMMYTTGQSLNDGGFYRQRWVMRINAYINLDFRKEEKKIPSIKLSD